MDRLIGNSVEFTVPQDIKTTYDWVVAINGPSKFILKTGPVPGFKSYKLLEGDWKHAGDQRKVTLTDDSVITEQIKTITRPTYFDFEISDIQSPMLSKILARGLGRWWFESTPSGGTHVTWSHAFQPTNPLLAPLLWVFMHTLYKNLMKTGVKSILHYSRTEDFKLI